MISFIKIMQWVIGKDKDGVLYADKEKLLERDKHILKLAEENSKLRESTRHWREK